MPASSMRPCCPCHCCCCLCLRLHLRLPCVGCCGTRAVHLAGATASGMAFKQHAMGFCAPLKPPSLQEGGKAKEGRMTLSRQRRWLGRQPPRTPASSVATIVVLKPPPSSSIITLAILSLGCNTTMCTSAGGEGNAPVLAPASPVEIEPVSTAADRGGTGSLLWSLRGGQTIPPPPLAADRRTPRRRRRRRRQDAY